MLAEIRGRSQITIPAEIIKKLGISEGDKFDIVEKDPIEIYVEGSSIILKKFEPNCVFCGSTKNLVKYKDKLICSKCADNLMKLKEEKKN